MFAHEFHIIRLCTYFVGRWCAKVRKYTVKQKNYVKINTIKKPNWARKINQYCLRFYFGYQ